MKLNLIIAAIMLCASTANAAVVIVRPVVIPARPVVVPRAPTAQVKPAKPKPIEYHYQPTPITPAIYPYLYWSQRGECYDERTKEHRKCDALKKEKGPKK